MLITRTEIILAIHSHTSQLSVAVGRHFLPLYACAHVVSFPNDRLLGMRLAPTFELMRCDAKVKLVGHVGNRLQWLKLYRDIDSKKGQILQPES